LGLNHLKINFRTPPNLNVAKDLRVIDKIRTKQTGKSENKQKAGERQQGSE
jgi:hypothetical protein